MSKPLAAPDGPVPATGKLNYSPEVNDAVSRVREIREDLARIAFSWQRLGENVAKAYDRRDWEKLGYQTWKEYCAAEYSSDQLPRAPKAELSQLVSSLAANAGMSTRAIGDALGIGKCTVNGWHVSQVGHLPRTGRLGWTGKPTRVRALKPVPDTVQVSSGLKEMPDEAEDLVEVAETCHRKSWPKSGGSSPAGKCHRKTPAR